MSVSTLCDTTYINGIYVDDVEALIGAVDADPAAGASRWRVASTWQGRMASRARIEAYRIGGERIERGFTLNMDEPMELGGANLYANPQEFLLAALNGCMMAGYAALCSLQGIDIDRLEIVTEGDIDLRGFLGLSPSVAPGYEALKTTVTICGSATPAEFRKIHEQVLATSPNVHTMTRPVSLEANLVIA